MQQRKGQVSKTSTHRVRTDHLTGTNGDGVPTGDPPRPHGKGKTGVELGGLYGGEL